MVMVACRRPKDHSRGELADLASRMSRHDGVPTSNRRQSPLAVLAAQLLRHTAGAEPQVAPAASCGPKGRRHATLDGLEP